MSNLIERLRSHTEYIDGGEDWLCEVLDDCKEAADELERLREHYDKHLDDRVAWQAEIERLREQVVNLQTRNNALYEAIDILKRGGKLK